MTTYTTEAVVVALADEIAATSSFINTYLNSGLDASIAGGMLLWRAVTVYGVTRAAYPSIILGQVEPPKTNTGKGKVYLTAVRVARYFVKHPETAKTLCGDLPFADAVAEGVKWCHANGFTSREQLDAFVDNRDDVKRKPSPYVERFTKSITKAVIDGEVSNIAEAEQIATALVKALGLDKARAAVKAAQVALKALDKAAASVIVTETVEKLAA